MAGMVPYFEWFCINCHESNDPEMRAPSREALRRMDPERILQALTTGPMAEFVRNSTRSSYARWQSWRAASRSAASPIGRPTP